MCFDVGQEQQHVQQTAESQFLLLNANSDSYPTFCRESSHDTDYAAVLRSIEMNRMLRVEIMWKAEGIMTHHFAFPSLKMKRVLKERPEQKSIDNTSCSDNETLSAQWVLDLIMIVTDASLLRNYNSATTSVP